MGRKIALGVLIGSVLLCVGGLCGCELWVRKKEAYYANLLREVASEVVVQQLSQKEAVMHIRNRLGDQEVGIGSEATAISESDYWQEELPDLIEYIEHLSFGFGLPKGIQYWGSRNIGATIRFRDGAAVSWSVHGTGADYDDPKYSGTK